MTKPLIKIHNIETGEIVERDMNASELEQLAADKAAYTEAKAAEEAKAADKAALLTRLGISEDEAKLLLS